MPQTVLIGLLSYRKSAIRPMKFQYFLCFSPHCHNGPMVFTGSFRLLNEGTVPHLRPYFVGESPET